MNPPTIAPADTVTTPAPPAAAPPISLRGVVKRFKEKSVLDALDLDIPAGSVTGLLGKNGAGKTTLIKCALGLLRPQSGTLTVLGEPAWDLSAQAKARLGYVPQTVQLYAWMRVRQVIAYTASFYDRWNQPLVDRPTRQWELDPQARVGPLSAGQLQKLAILLAMGHEPELLVLDEPAAALDPAARREFLQTLLEIAAQGGRTVLFSTHITSDLERVADRVAILQAGKITYNGELDALKDSVKRLHVVARETLPPRLEVPGVLHQKVEGREALLSVRECSAALVGALESRYGASVEVRDLNLEDIFLEMHGG